MEHLAWKGMVHGQHGRKRYKETFSTGRNCKRKRSHGKKKKLQEDTFGISGNCTTGRLAREEMSQRINDVRAHSARK